MISIILIFIGDTRDLLEETAQKYNWQNYTIVTGDFKEGVIAAKNKAKEGYNVLLSPACASFDMFKDFEERGEVFKQIVSEF